MLSRFTKTLSTLLCRCSFLIRIILLGAGYYFLSPENCASAVKWFTELSAIKWLTGLSAIKWFVAQSEIEWLMSQSCMPHCADDLVLLVMKLVPPLILFWAVLFVIRLFIYLPISKIWLFLTWFLLGFVIFIAPWKPTPEELKDISRYYDAFYASFVLVLFAGWLASMLYGFSRSGGAKALALVLFVVVGSLMYEWLASLDIIVLRDERWLRPGQLLDCIFGVVKKQSDFDNVSNTFLATKAAFGLFYTFHALLAFFGGYVIIGFVSKAAVNTMLLRFSRTPDSIFWGVSPEAIVLAKSLRDEKKEKCIFVIADLASVNGGELDMLSDEGFLWVSAGRGTLQLVAQKVKKHFFLSASGSVNVDWASKLVEFVTGEPEVYVRIDDETDDSWLFHWADREEIRKKLNVHIVRETSLVADILLREHPMLKAPNVKCKDGKIESNSSDDFSFRLLQIGFGHQGRLLLNRMICDTQAPGLKFSAVIVDKSQAAFDGYEILCPDVKEKYKLDFKNYDVQTKAFFDWLTKLLKPTDTTRITDFTRIVVTTGSDDLNLFVASFIVKYFKEQGFVRYFKEKGEDKKEKGEDSFIVKCFKGIVSHLKGKKEEKKEKVEDRLANLLFVRVRHPESFADFNKGQDSKYPLSFTPFGADKEIYSYQSIVNLDIDRVARQLNAKWAGDKEPIEAWRETSFFNRESSRASAMGVKNLWRLTGGEEVENLTPKQIVEKWTSVISQDGILDRLADAEHRRWMAFHYVRGIRPWNVEPKQNKIAENAIDDANNNPESGVKGKQLKANQIKAANSHAALVPTYELFRMDVYLDKMSFEQLKSNNKLFGLYADELGHQLEKASANCTEKDFSNNNSLLALNRCVFALWDATIILEKYKKSKILEKVQNQLKDFSEKAFKAYQGEDNVEAKLAQILVELKKNIKDAGNVSFLQKICCRNELSVIQKLLKKLNKRKQGSFNTLGNMVGNDVDIVKEVPKYLKSFLHSEDVFVR